MEKDNTEWTEEVRDDVPLHGVVHTSVGQKVTPLEDPDLWVASCELWDCTKNTNDLANTITMVAELPVPPAAWIWWIHAAWGVGGLAHVCSKAAVKAI